MRIQLSPYGEVVAGAHGLRLAVSIFLAGSGPRGMPKSHDPSCSLARARLRRRPFRENRLRQGDADTLTPRQKCCPAVFPRQDSFGYGTLSAQFNPNSPNRGDGIICAPTLIGGLIATCLAPSCRVVEAPLACLDFGAVASTNVALRTSAGRDPRGKGRPCISKKSTRMRRITLRRDEAPGEPHRRHQRASTEKRR
jgi:hypothetical protein